MSRPGNRSRGRLSEPAVPGRTGGLRERPMKAGPDRESIAARVDEETGEVSDAALDAEGERILEEMRSLRDVLRAEGPVQAPVGLTEAILARAARERAEERKIVAFRRRERVFVWAQAASLAALCLLYGALLAGTRVRQVAPRWDDAKKQKPPAAAALAEPAGEPFRPLLALNRPQVLRAMRNPTEETTNRGS
jgi:hypothetical protein